MILRYLMDLLIRKEKLTLIPEYSNVAHDETGSLWIPKQRENLTNKEYMYLFWLLVLNVLVLLFFNEVYGLLNTPRGHMNTETIIGMFITTMIMITVGWVTFIIYLLISLWLPVHYLVNKKFNFFPLFVLLSSPAIIFIFNSLMWYFENQ